MRSLSKVSAHSGFIVYIRKEKSFWWVDASKDVCLWLARVLIVKRVGLSSRITLAALPRQKQMEDEDRNAERDTRCEQLWEEGRGEEERGNTATLLRPSLPRASEQKPALRTHKKVHYSLSIFSFLRQIRTGPQNKYSCLAADDRFKFPAVGDLSSLSDPPARRRARGCSRQHISIHTPQFLKTAVTYPLSISSKPLPTLRLRDLTFLLTKPDLN